MEWSGGGQWEEKKGLSLILATIKILFLKKKKRKCVKMLTIGESTLRIYGCPL